MNQRRSFISRVLLGAAACVLPRKMPALGQRPPDRNRQGDRMADSYRKGEDGHFYRINRSDAKPGDEIMMLGADGDEVFMLTILTVGPEGVRVLPDGDVAVYHDESTKAVRLIGEEPEM